jgi:uncharacterized membrane protein
MSFLSGLFSPVKKYFLSGVLVVVPIILTYLVLKVLFNAVDGILQPIILHFFGVSIPGLGIVTTLVLILVVGLITRNLLGTQVVHLWDSLMEKMPVIRPIYSASKKLLEALTSGGSGSFKEVALIEYPRKGVYALGFVAQRVRLDIERAGQEMVTVFIPSTPTPMSGMVVFVPVEDVIWLDMTVEAGLSFIVSGGVAISKTVLTRPPKVQPTSGGKS